MYFFVCFNKNSSKLWYICTQQTTPAYRRCALGVVFYFILLPKLKIYTKPSLTYQEQLELLKKRGLTIEDPDKAIHLLGNLSYYRLTGYLYPMLKDPKEDHIFKEKSTFENAFKIYCFDRELKQLLSGEIEKIEVSFRSKITKDCLET